VIGAQEERFAHLCGSSLKLNLELGFVAANIGFAVEPFPDHLLRFGWHLDDLGLRHRDACFDQLRKPVAQCRLVKMRP
jgi:hypothetical protein